MAKATIWGVTIDDPSQSEIFDHIANAITGHRSEFIVTINSELLQLCLTNPDFNSATRAASLRLCDGVGVQWVATFLHRRHGRITNLIRLPFSLLRLLIQPSAAKRVIKHRTTGRLLFEDLLGWAAENGHSVFFLGGGAGVAEQVSVKAKVQYPKLRVAGSFSGDPEEPTAIFSAIAASNLLFVAYGSPKQEIFIHQHLSKLRANVVIGVGGTFDAFVGAKPIGSKFKQIRPPAWINRAGLESFWRLATQPNRFGRVWNSVVGLALRAALTKS